MSTKTTGDVDEFTRLKADDDPRTIEQMIAEDEQSDWKIERVEKGDDGWFYLSWDNGTTSGFKCPEGVEPKVGDDLRIYGYAGLGGSKHGWALNGKLMEWRTPWERFAERVRWLADHDREKRERFAAEKDRMDARYEALSPPLKARIDRFRAERADFRIDSENYEMYACTDADVIANHLRPRVEAGENADDVIREFYDLPWDEQKTIGLQDGHSGNTFGGACSLARALLKGLPV